MEFMGWILFAVMAVLCVVMLFFAGKSVRRKNERMKVFYQKANRQQALYEKYRAMPPEALKSEPAMDVLEGLAVAVQRELESEPDANGVFRTMPQWKQRVYASYYFFFDSREKLSVFFRKNAEPLLSAAVECLLACQGFEAEKTLIQSEYEMLDDNNETVSVDNAKIAGWDAAFAACDTDGLCESVKQLILSQMPEV